MKAIVLSTTGGPDVLELVERPVPEPGPGEVRVRLALSGVNPTDWKCRQYGHVNGKLMYPEVIPHHDGSGLIDAVGPGVGAERVGQRVWVWESAWRRPHGTAANSVVLPSQQAVQLPENASLELGATLGVRAIAAHRCLLTLHGAPDRLGPGTLAGRTVLVAGGAGAVGHAVIQLAVWSGATVVATVSTPEKAKLARAAGAAHVVDYRSDGVIEDIRAFAPDGVDLVADVDAAANLATNLQVLGPRGTVAVYGTEGDEEVTLPIRLMMGRNLRYAFILGLTLPPADKLVSVADITAAAAAGALTVGEEAGLPLVPFPIERVREAHVAVQDGAIGKVLVDVA